MITTLYLILYYGDRNMSQVKQQKRVKTGTVAIIALSLVLVLSLVATITLAYFTASRNVITTVKFANGVSLQMHGVAFKTEGDQPADHQAGDVDTPPSNAAADLYWIADYTDTTDGHVTHNSTKRGDYEDVNAQLTFKDILVRTVDSDAFVAVKLVVRAVKHTANDASVTLTSEMGYEPPSWTDDWMDYTDAGKGWKTYKGNGKEMVKLPHNGITTESEKTHPTYTDSANFTALFESGYVLPNDANKVNNFAGVTVTYSIYVMASDTKEGLKKWVNSSEHASDE